MWVVVYFVPVIFIGAFFLLNLTLAVINSNFSEQHEKNAKQKLEKKLTKKPKLYGTESEEDIPDLLKMTRMGKSEVNAVHEFQKKLM